MRRAGNVVVVICGFVGGSIGYAIGHLAGWSDNSEWRTNVFGSGTGAILTRPLALYLLSIGMAVLFVCLAALFVTWLQAPDDSETRRGPQRHDVSRRG